MKTVAFIPIKLNNERLPGKNIKAFDNGEPLISYILNTALKVDGLDEIYVYCSSDSIKEYLPEGIKFLKRSKELDLSSASITDIMTSFSNDIDADIYVLLHATTPFLSHGSINKAINAVKNDGYDSAIGAKRYNAFLWKNGKPDNYDTTYIPRTQDLEPFYIETCGLYVFTKDVINQKRRVGDKPTLIEVSDIEAIDIDEPVDFEIANAVFNTVLKN